MGGGHDEVVQRLTEIGKRRRWALFKKTWLNAAVGPVAVIVATGCLAISFFTYRIFRDNNTVNVREKSKRGQLYYTPTGNLIKSDDQKERHEAKRQQMRRLNGLSADEALVQTATITNRS